MHPLRFIGCFLLVAGLVHALAQPGEELLTDAEIAALGRENAMWRLANPDEGLAANVARLRQAGYSEEEIATLQPRLAAMWTVPFERNFGWLKPETVERIRTVDREFVARMRAAQLHERTGIRVAGGGREDTATINRLWRVAIVHALAPYELGEFNLNNSAAARQEARFARGLALTADEQRTLFEWRRDYDGRRGMPLGTEGAMSDWQREMLLDQCRRLHDLLGDERFSTYLGRANPSFARMLEALTRDGPISPTVALGLWWMRRKDGAERDAATNTVQRDELTMRMRTRAAELMGEARLAAYEQNADARWLVIPVRPHQRSSGMAAGIRSVRQTGPH